MSYNGSGIWVRLYNWTNDAANGIKIRADRMDAEFNDMCNNGLSAVVTRGGQSPFTANIPAGGFKMTNLAAGTASGDSVCYGQNVSFGTLAATGAATANSLAIGGASLSGNAVAVTGDVSVAGNGSFNFNTTGGSLKTGANGLTVEGFGVNTNYAVDGSIVTSSGNGVRVVCISNGVVLNNGASSWSAISGRKTKKDLERIQGALQTVNNMGAYLGRYKWDDKSVKLRPFLIYEEAEQHFPYITTYRAAHKMEHKHPETGAVLGVRDVQEHKGIMYDSVVPLLIAAIQELSTQVDDLKSIISAKA